MITLLALFVIVFGFIIGSFLNVVALRLNTGRSVNGRSFCFTCNTQLRWYELIPVFSFLMQSGKCNTCSARISPQYPIVEAVTGFAFLLIIWKETAAFEILTQTTLLLTFFYWLVASILIVISVYDLKHKIIPDSFSYSLIVLSLIKLIVLYKGALFTTEHIYDLIAGPALFLPFFLLWFVSRGRWMGFGDAKLALGLGWLLGLPVGASAIMFSFWFGMIIIAIIFAFSHIKHHIKRRAKKGEKYEPLTLKSEIPFAPFMILGACAAYLTNADVMSINLLISIINM